VQDCRGWVLGPGLVDLYSHSGEPGFEERETLASLLQSARAGGFTRLAILPDTVPALDNPASIAWLHDLQRDRYGPHLYIWAALTIATHGQQMTELAELAALDIIGFADGKPLTNLALVRRLLEYLRSLNKPVALWACEPVLGGNGVVREGADSIRFGLPGIPAIAETLPLAGLLECIEATGTPVHLMKLSTARGVELIRSAKARGLPVTASATWMHLLLDTNALGSYDPNLRLDPPLGTPSDRLALIQAVQEGVIDAIAIDHTPYTYEEKTVAFAEAPPGAIGLELALPLLWHTFVQSGRWSALELWRRLSTDPARCLQQQGPAAIAPNQPAELTLFNPQQMWAVEAQSLHCHSSNTPWLGQPVVGRVIKTWCP
ncbi:dihydroorotase, partial [Leptolyngbya sp. FACHB-36]|uniref:dihydroorotase n=1 Tax=Leptolyngbya sp. FACHB-36 TaxID=2692808 RepID=UPI001680E9EF